MDLSVSPDLPAFCTYGLVGSLGAWSARRQIADKLSGIPGVWPQWRTLLLLALYTALPLGLFWALDRGGAIADTSLFAAALIGLGYQQILAGKNEAIRTPGALSQFWTPFQDYTDSIAEAARQNGSRRRRRVEDRIIARLAADADAFNRFWELSRTRLPDVARVEADLREMETRHAGLGERNVRERQVRWLLIRRRAFATPSRTGSRRRWSHRQAWRAASDNGGRLCGGQPVERARLVLS